MIYVYDCETRSDKDVRDHGVDNHADPAVTEVSLVVLHGFGDDPETVVWRPMYEPIPHQMMDPGNLYVAHNSRFDRIVYDRVLRAMHPSLPVLPLEAWHDSAVIARANGFRSSLDSLLRALGLPLKAKSNAASATFSRKTPLPEDAVAWTALIHYGRYDVLGLADALDRPQMVLPSDAIWHEFHMAERVNDRGLPIDVELLDQVRAHLQPVVKRFQAEFRSMTGLNPTQTKKINHWVVSGLPTHLKYLALSKAGRPSLDKRTNLPAVIDHPETPWQIKKALQLLAEARKSSLSKLESIAALVHDGRIKGAYVFHGAGATGRFSSKGAQVHNFPKDEVLPETVEILSRENSDLVVGAKTGTPDRIYWRDLPKVASRSLRALIKSPDGAMVWVDWSAIEACVLPWLTQDPRCDERLSILREAGDIYMKTVKDVWGNEDRSYRQAGKALELALGFCGGFNAMTTFCENLGVELDDENKSFALAAWREANQWALDFGDALMDAFVDAFYGKAATVGRLMLIPWPQFKGVAMVLPDQRRIIYPHVSLTANGAEFTKFRDNGTVERTSVWRGLLSENATQGTAASLLRSKIAQVESTRALPEGAELVGTTHDEMIVEVKIPANAERTAKALSRIMVTPPAWLRGCPLNVEWSYGERYAMAQKKGKVRGIDIERGLQ